MKKPTDYTKGLIYKIYCNDENITDIYIGSTVDFKDRKGKHKRNCHNEKKPGYNCKVYKFIRDNGGWSNWCMIELHKYPCSNKRELLQEEDRMMNELKSTLNSQRAFRTEEERIKYYIEYHANNRETINKKSAKHRAKNRETLNKRGAEYRAKNKESLAIKRKEKIKCINCGCMITRCSLTTHMKRNICINYNKPPPDTLDNNKE